MKRILIFSLAYYPHVGGAEVAVKEITDRIAPSDIEFHMVTMRFSPQEKREEKIGNVMVHRVGSGSGSKFAKLGYQIASAEKKAVIVHTEQKFDGIWAIMAHSAGVPAARFSKKTGLPFALSLQEGDPPAHIERIMLPLRYWFTQAFVSARVVQAISTYLGGWARKRGFNGPLEIIPNGVDTKTFVGEKVAHGGIVLITTSRLVKKNAVDDVIRALPLLPEHVRFKILGTGPDEQMLKALVQKLGMSARVEFLGHIDHTQMPAYLHAADIFVRPSRSEGMGNSFIEAFAAGLPVVATQEGGIADFLFDAKRNPDQPTTGWAVDHDSPGQIAEAVKNILQNPEQVQKVVQTARALALQKYDWDLIAKDMKKKVFYRVLGSTT